MPGLHIGTKWSLDEIILFIQAFLFTFLFSPTTNNSAVRSGRRNMQTEDQMREEVEWKIAAFFLEEVFLWVNV